MGRRKHRKAAGKAEPKKPASWELAVTQLKKGVLGGLMQAVAVYRDNTYPMSKADWAYVTSDGHIFLNCHRDADVQEWKYVLAHCLLHLGLDHVREDRMADPQWITACDLVVTRFLSDNRLGRRPAEFDRPLPLPAKNEEDTLEQLRDLAGSPECLGFGTMTGRPDMVWNGRPRPSWLLQAPPDFPSIFAQSLQDAIVESLRMAGEGPMRSTREIRRRQVWDEARSWFVSGFPLLGAVAAVFRIVDDEQTAISMHVPVAAVSAELQEIYINPRRTFDPEEWKFILAHEFLHAALRHDLRCEWRDPVLWNVACDFVINGWLTEMRVGLMPEGALYDTTLSGLSAEAVYDRLWKDRKYYLGPLQPEDILYGSGPGIDGLTGQELDDFYRSALQRGLTSHRSQGRGFLPCGLVEEIYALSRPPIRWDVELAKWFDAQFTLPEKRRTYARLSRRQSSTPDIPRPAWHCPEKLASQHTFAVLLDTSGSMDRRLLAAALGSVASYSMARDVASVRVVFCDAAAYDQGMMRPEDIAGAVQVRGRGGTKLQPGIDLIDHDETFPRHAPLLVITDGECDVLRIHGREHAYLIPRGRRLPFAPKGPVFVLT
ncbi:MAG: peptidase [Clostridia bacterium]|nr:peptidase [Clostridia bacterium]